MTAMRMLAVASRPSDYVEMSDLARALAARGHEMSLLLLYSRDDPAASGVLEQLAILSAESGVSGVAVEVSELPDGLPARDAAAGPEPVAVPPPAPSAATDRLRSLALWARRRGLNIYPKNTIVGRAAYGATRLLDALRDRERMAQARELFGKLRPRLQQLPLVLRLEARVRLYQAAASIQYYRQFATFFRNSIARRKLQAILIPEDIVGSVWPVAIRAGHDAGIPTVVLPYTLANREEAIQSLKGAGHFQARANRVAAALYPRWRYQHGQVDIVRLPSGHILAHEELGITPPDPWMMNSGFADKILVDSDASLQYFLDGGIPRGQLAVVGSVSQDRMSQLRQDRSAHLQQLRQELGLTGDKPLLLISGCPNQLTASVPSCEFATMEALVAFVGESVAPLAAHYHLVVRPHPNFVEFGAMLAPYGVAVTNRPTSSVVPLSDLFIAFASATIRWAIGCGIPTVNYDVFHYGYGDFAATTGVQSVDGSGAFRDAVRSLTPASPRLKALAEHALRDSARWSVMDGRGIDRIEEEIERARERRAALYQEQQQHA